MSVTSINVLVYLSFYVVSAEECHLQWTLNSNGKVDPNALDAFDFVGPQNGTRGHSYIARTIRDGLYYPSKLLFGMQRENSNGVYEVLANPNMCRIEWTPSSAGSYPKNAVSYGRSDYGNLFVCRGYGSGGCAKLQEDIDQVAFEAGYLSDNGRFATYCAAAAALHPNYEVLTVVKGLETVVEHFEYDFQESAVKKTNNTRIVLVDTLEVANPGPSSKKQHVEFRKDIEQLAVFHFEDSFNWSHKVQVSVGYSLWFTAFSVNFKHTSDKSQIGSKNLIHKEKKPVVMSSSIEVDPGSIAVAKAYVQLSETKRIPFLAKARMTGNGLEGNAIKATLQSKGFKGHIVQIGPDFVLAEVNGEAAVTFVVESYIKTTYKPQNPFATVFRALTEKSNERLLAIVDHDELERHNFSSNCDSQSSSLASTSAVALLFRTMVFLTLFSIYYCLCHAHISA